MVRYGIIGTGYFGAEIGRFLTEIDGATVTAVYDPEHADRVANELAARVAGTVDELCSATDVDAVIVASPNWIHKEGVFGAARAGKPVFSEKPIALNYADCSAMIRATAEADVLFMAGHVMNFMAGVRESRRIIDAGEIGDLLFVRAIRNGWEDVQDSVSWKKQRSLSGGHLYHHIHELDFVQSLLGPATDAYMTGGNVAHSGPQFGDEDDMLLISLQFEGSRFATLEYGSAFRWPEHYVLIQGTQGAIRIDLQDAGVELRVGGESRRFLLHRTEQEDADRSAIYSGSRTDGAVQYGNPHRRPPMWLRGIIEEEMRYFHGLLSGAAPEAEFAGLTDGSAAAASIATADALTLSLQEGRKVAVAEITGADLATTPA
ncbi:MAG TPA: Gfo/Idh/MocA family oxidoreductase [Candidatus Ruania gallistercoris]|uniref:Gfo/Idh/MocA family oxidoreductase n=1 Tax=Candidatus Ruania gallistercoris TaxID=2838746 RepID=A0A9D2EG28_9MICO|nr:Gfo/Idh/MocA family oxidoreductase [Candidatus Ruania gallistercoris]